MDATVIPGTPDERRPDMPGPRAVADPAPARAVFAALPGGDEAVLALVVETEGSTYSGVGAIALFDGGTRHGWLSGGCLEPAIAATAADVARTRRLGAITLDTRDDDALFSGAAVGCRGLLHVVLLPLAAMPGVGDAVSAWLAGGRALSLGLAPAADDAVRIAVRSDGAAGADDLARTWTLHADDGAAASAGVPFALRWPRLPELLVFGGGPEAAVLLPLLRGLGWRTTLVERRERWLAAAALADAHLALDAAAALASPGLACDAALVMHHAFEPDLLALQALAARDCGFVGLLGPRRRRDDLLRLLPAAAAASLRPRLRAPAGLDLGGRGADAIALSIAAQLQAWRSGR